MPGTVIAYGDRQTAVARPWRRRRSARRPASTARRSRADATAPPRSAADRDGPDARNRPTPRTRAAASACSTLICAPPRRSPSARPSGCPRRPPRHRCAPSRECSETDRVSRSTSVRIRSLCSRRSRSSGHDACRLLAATRIAVSGVRRSWPSDASSADFSASLWRATVGRLALVEKLRALDRDRRQPGNRIEGPGVRSTGRRPPADRSACSAEPRSRDDARRRCAAVGRRRRAGAVKDRGQFARIERERPGSGGSDAPPGALRHADRDVVEVEPAAR